MAVDKLLLVERNFADDALQLTDGEFLFLTSTVLTPGPPSPEPLTTSITAVTYAAIHAGANFQAAIASAKNTVVVAPSILTALISGE